MTQLELRWFLKIKIKVHSSMLVEQHMVLFGEIYCWSKINAISFQNDRICNQISLNNTMLFHPEKFNSKVLFAISRHFICLCIGFRIFWGFHLTCVQCVHIYWFALQTVQMLFMNFPFEMYFKYAHAHMHNAMHRPFKIEWQKI